MKRIIKISLILLLVGMAVIAAVPFLKEKRAKRKCMEKFVEIKVRMTPERRSAVQAHAEAQGESTTGFINRAIDETMERDNAAPGAAGEATEGG